VSDFLLELRSEEIPARMQAGARADLERLFRREMVSAGVVLGDVIVWSTPRRLVLIAGDLPEATQAASEELKGPPEGAPDAALDGFSRKAGVTRQELMLREVKGRATWFALVETPGRSTKDVLATAIPAIIRDFPWPKSMRWGAESVRPESLRWVRPLSGIVALLGEELVECEVHDVTSGWVTPGHRFHHKGDITIGSAADYVEKLRACHVIVDHAERETLIREGAREAAARAGLTLVEDEGLVVENAGLTEWPVPLLGRFDEAFLEVPPEVIQLTARVNQKYFVCNDGEGRLANAFICTANIAAEDGGTQVVDGNRKVLAARLSDARFFWEQDRKKTLAQHAEGLARITFHEKLGTVADKVERVSRLARWLAEEGIVKGADPDQVEQAARLAKADLVTEMVGEFPELQGLMGGYYARAEGLSDAVSGAIRDHYNPVGQGDEVPTAPVTVAVSLADKLDTLVAFFLINEKPTGSKDPFALRRSAIGLISLILVNGLRLDLSHVVGKYIAETERNLTSAFVQTGSNAALLTGSGDVLNFLADRLKVQQREAGVRHDLIDAVFACQKPGGGNEDDLVRLLARVNALQNFIATEDGADLLAAYKRAANILKKENWRGHEGEIARTGEEDPLAVVDDPDLGPIIAAKMAERHADALAYTPEPAERALIEALDKAEPESSAAVEQEDFGAAMAALASLRVPIDRFFDEVTVNDADGGKRATRLDLLGRFRAAVHNVADFSRIEG